MSLTTVRNKINDWLNPRWATLVTKQDDYFSTYARYFQGIWSHSSDLEQTDLLDGDTLADNLGGLPSDQVHDWRDYLGNTLDTLKFPCRLRIDVYEGPQGHGWQAVLQVLYKGDLYSRTQQVGPETSRTKSWGKVIPTL